MKEGVITIEIYVWCALKERGLAHVARPCSVEMPASIHMSGNYWDLTWDSMEISNLYFFYITFYVLLFITRIIHDIKKNK